MNMLFSESHVTGALRMSSTIVRFRGSVLWQLAQSTYTRFEQRIRTGWCVPAGVARRKNGYLLIHFLFVKL